MTVLPEVAELSHIAENFKIFEMTIMVDMVK